MYILNKLTRVPIISEGFVTVSRGIRIIFIRRRRNRVTYDVDKLRTVIYYVITVGATVGGDRGTIRISFPVTFFIRKTKHLY